MATLSSDLPIVMGSAIQTERDNVAEDFPNKIADKFVEIQEKEAKIEEEKIRCFLMSLTDR